MPIHRWTYHNGEFLAHITLQGTLFLVQIVNGPATTCPSLTAAQRWLRDYLPCSP